MATFRQQKASASTASDQSIAFDADVQIGSLLLVAMRDAEYVTGTPVVTDTQDNAWTLVTTAPRMHLFWAIAGSSGPCTVLVDSLSTGAMRYVLAEFGGLWGSNPVDVVGASATSTTSMTNTVPAVTPTLPSGVLFAIQGTGGYATAIDIDSGYTIGPRAHSLTSFQIATAYRCFTAIDAYAPTFSGTGAPASGVNVKQIAFSEISGPTPAAVDYYRRHCGLT